MGNITLRNLIGGTPYLIQSSLSATPYQVVPEPPYILFRNCSHVSVPSRFSPGSVRFSPLSDPVRSLCRPSSRSLPVQFVPAQARCCPGPVTLHTSRGSAPVTSCCLLSSVPLEFLIRRESHFPVCSLRPCSLFCSVQPCSYVPCSVQSLLHVLFSPCSSPCSDERSA